MKTKIELCYFKKSSNSTEPYFVNEYKFSININYYVDH